MAVRKLAIFLVFVSILTKDVASKDNSAAEDDLCENISCPDGETCNPNLGECFPDVPSTSKLHVWLGKIH